MKRHILGLLAISMLMTGCGLFRRDRYKVTSCRSELSQLAQAVGFQGKIKSTLPCPAVIPSGVNAQVVYFQGELWAAASEVFDNSLAITHKNKVGAVVKVETIYGNYVPYQNTVLWQPNLQFTVGTGGVSEAFPPTNIDTLIVAGRAASGSVYKARFFLTYRRPFPTVATLTQSGTAYEGSSGTVYLDFGSTSMVGTVEYDWEVDGEIIEDPTWDYAYTFAVPTASAGQTRAIRVVATDEVGTQVVAYQTVTFQGCPGGCQQQ